MNNRHLVTLNATGQVSGAERVLIRLMDAAVDAGWQVTCLAPVGDLSDQLPEGVAHVAIPELGLADGPRWRAIPVTLWRWLATAALVRRIRGTVLVANSLLSMPALRLAVRTIPAVWLAHDVVVARSRVRLYRACRGALTGVAAVSNAVAQRLPRGGPEIRVVHNGVEWPVEPAYVTTPGAVSSGRTVIGINGLLTPWKGHRTVLKAVAGMPDDVTVELLGGSLVKDGAYAREIIEAAGRDERVVVVGHDPDPLARMRTWSLAISASTDPEACPLSVLEAMSLGLPVVGTDLGGTPEVLRDAGVLVPPNDPEALCEAVTRLLADPDLTERLGARARQLVETHHDKDTQTRELLSQVERFGTREPS